MQISEILSLNRWYGEKIIDSDVLNAYNRLAKAVQNNVNSSAKTSFTDEREDVSGKIVGVNCSDLTLEQINLLEQMGILNLVGEQGKTAIDELFSDGLLDIAAVANRLAEYCKKLDDAHSYLTNISGLLTQYFQIDKENEIDDNEALVRIYFKEQAAIDNLSDFKEKGAEWYQIGRGIALATDTAPEDIRIIGAEKGSIILDIVATMGIVGVISRIVLEVLKVSQRLLDIRKGLLEIENLKLQNQKITQEIQREMDNEEKKLVEGVVKALEAEPGIYLTDGEKKDALRKSIELLVKFTKGGGKLDFIHNETIEEETEEDETDEKIEELRKSSMAIDKNAQEIREIESKIARLTLNEQG